MSSALAIAAVTYLVRDLLNDGLIDNTTIGRVNVTARPPVRDPVRDSEEKSQLNLFLYQVTPNAAWRNVALPSRDFKGERVTNPPLALDLHYLVTAYDERDYHAEVLLGYAMQLFHENPGLSRVQIRKSLDFEIPDDTDHPLPLKQLKASGLADQFESLKITPSYLSTEEMSKLWTGFQAPYRPSMAYQISVVLIETEQPTRSALPVRTRNLQAVPFSLITLEEISPLRAAQGEKIILRGTNLAGANTRLFFGKVEAQPLKISETEIEVKVPVGLQAGVNTVRLVREIQFGISSDPHRGFESNQIVFQLVPEISPVGNAKKFKVAHGGTLDVDVKPAVLPEQKVQLLIAGQPEIILPPRASGSAALNTVSFQIPDDAKPGDYLLRLRVDGADSVPEYESDPSNSAGGKFTGPFLTIT